MLTPRQARQARENLDSRLRRLRRATPATVPSAGWIRAVRDALGMSSADLARRTGVTRAAVAAMESSERARTIRLSTLDRAAEAMGCTVVYALVPNDSLETTVRERALELIEDRDRYVHQTMLLEDQDTGVPTRELERRIDAVIEMGRLWSETGEPRLADA